MDASSSPNQDADKMILNLLTQYNDAMVILEHFEEGEREELYTKLSDIVESFKLMQKTEGITGSVPLQLIQKIEQGENPDDFAKMMVDECQRISNEVEKKSEWMKHLKNSLDKLIALNFPDEAPEI